MNVLFHFEVGQGLSHKLAALSARGLNVEACAPADDRRFRDLIERADVLWHVLRPVGEDDMAAAPRLKLIQKIGVGVDTIDLEETKRRGIRVCNMPGTNTPAVAEMTLALMFAASRRLTAFDAATRRGEGWTIAPRVQDHLGEVGGRTVGLVGYGAVPRLLAPVLRALGARVLYHTHRPKDDAPADWRDLPALLGESDIVSLHVPLTPETQGMLDAGAFARMKAGAIVINTSRGGVVEANALVSALESGRVAAAGLDVFAVEPIDPSDPLLALDNVVLSPHVAWLTTGTLDRSVAVAAENCRRLASGETLLHRVV